MYWVPKMHNNPIKAKFIITFPKSSIKSLAGTITSIFCLFFRQIQICNDRCRFFTDVDTFWVVQNNKPVTDATNGWRKSTPVSTFDFSTLYTKLPHNKILMVLNSLIDFCFDWGGGKYQFAYQFFNCYFAAGPKIFCEIIGIRMGSDLPPIFANLFLYFCESKWINELKNNDLMTARKLCNIFRVIDNLSSSNDDGNLKVFILIFILRNYIR